MNIILTETTEEQQQAAKEAAHKRYTHNLFTPDRAGWTGGKCPVSEYRAILAEMGAANFLGYDWRDLVLYSPNPSDYTKPDLGEWEVKAGSTFSAKDITKGASAILWVTPWVNANTFDCGYATCTHGEHQTLNGLVEIRGWTHLTEDLAGCADFGSYYKPTNMRSAAILLLQAVSA